MKTNNKLNHALIFSLVLTAALFSSCKKEKVNYDVLAEDANISESVYNDIFKKVDEESKSGQYSGEVGKTTLTYQSAFDACATIIFNTNSGSFPMTLSIDFGSGCTDVYGTTRKGKINLVYSGHYRESGSVITVSLENYFVNGYAVEGSKTITNDGRNVNGQLSFTVKVINGMITKPDGGIITWESTRTNVWAEGESTTGILGICDDVYLITGFGEGTTSEGDDYRIDVTKPLKKNICCYWVTEGTISYEVNGDEVATLDYGSGACDLSASLTYEGRTYVIVIR